jgi:hypothetical protein
MLQRRSAGCKRTYLLSQFSWKKLRKKGLRINFFATLTLLTTTGQPQGTIPPYYWLHPRDGRVPGQRNGARTEGRGPASGICLYQELQRTFTNTITLLLRVEEYHKTLTCVPSVGRPSQVHRFRTPISNSKTAYLLLSAGAFVVRTSGDTDIHTTTHFTFHQTSGGTQQLAFTRTKPYVAVSTHPKLVLKCICVLMDPQP